MAAVGRNASNEYELLFRKCIETCPPNLPRQPYHAVAEQGMPRSTIERVRSRAGELCSAAVSSALRESPGVRAAAVGMGRFVIPTDLDRILAAHSLLHAAEGELYRDALAEAAEASGLRVVRFLNKEVRSEAAASLGWPLDQLESWLSATGKEAGTPWTKDEKDATAAAMLALSVTGPR
jgi:hypothetical protein